MKTKEPPIYRVKTDSVPEQPTAFSNLMNIKYPLYASLCPRHGYNSEWNRALPSRDLHSSSGMDVSRDTDKKQIQSYTDCIICEAKPYEENKSG